MLLFASLLLLLLAPDLQHARPQDQDCEIFDCEPEVEENADCAIFGCEEPSASLTECDEIFDDCKKEEPIEVETRSDCFDSINEIDSLDNDGRSIQKMKI